MSDTWQHYNKYR